MQGFLGEALPTTSHHKLSHLDSKGNLMFEQNSIDAIKETK